MATPKNYEVHLEMFEGPLDLLLFLIKKNDLNVYDIPISQITREYLSYLDLMKDLNLEVAGEFLVLASTLMQIKARTLLPSQETEEDEGPDPRAELVAKLLEYQKFKEAAKFLDQRASEYSNVFYRGAPRFSEEEKTLNLRIFDLLDTLKEIIERSEDGGSMLVAGEEFPVEEKMQNIVFLLENKPFITFREIFKDERKRLGILTCFMALLELIKLQKIFARQDLHFGEILIYKREVSAAEPDLGGPGTVPAEGRGLLPVESSEATAPEPAVAPALEAQPAPTWTSASEMTATIEPTPLSEATAETDEAPGAPEGTAPLEASNGSAMDPEAN